MIEQWMPQYCIGLCIVRAKSPISKLSFILIVSASHLTMQQLRIFLIQTPKENGDKVLIQKYLILPLKYNIFLKSQ